MSVSSYPFVLEANLLPVDTQKIRIRQLKPRKDGRSAKRRACLSSTSIAVTDVESKGLRQRSFESHRTALTSGLHDWLQIETQPSFCLEVVVICKLSIVSLQPLTPGGGRLFVEVGLDNQSITNWVTTLLLFVTVQQRQGNQAAKFDSYTRNNIKYY